MGNGLRVFIGMVLWLSLAQVFAAKIVVSIPTLAMMVEPLLDEDDELVVLLAPGASPHGFQLKPSHMMAIEQAELVVSVGSGVDGWLQAALRNYKSDQLVMMQQPGLVVLSKRQGGVWEGSHNDAHHQHDEHEHSELNEQQKARIDGHIWLGLHNAKVLIGAVSQTLQAMQPMRAGAIAAREKAVIESLTARELVWNAELAPLKSEGFVVMHDAFQYFEHTFGLNAAGTIHVNPELPPSAKRLHELRQVIRNRNIRCVFTEPQFPQQRLRPVIQALNVAVGELDPVGVEQEIMPYEMFYDRLVQNFVGCFNQ